MYVCFACQAELIKSEIGTKIAIRTPLAEQLGQADVVLDQLIHEALDTKYDEVRFFNVDLELELQQKYKSCFHRECCLMSLDREARVDDPNA